MLPRCEVVSVDGVEFSGVKKRRIALSIPQVLSTKMDDPIR
jgi:hypothetical protein